MVVPGGSDGVDALAQSGLGRYYVQEAYKHLKAIAAVGDAKVLLDSAGVPTGEEGVLTGASVDDVFTPLREAMGQHRIWARDPKANDMPA